MDVKIGFGMLILANQEIHCFMDLIAQLKGLPIYVNNFLSKAINYLPKLVLAIVLLVIGLKLIQILINLVTKHLHLKRLDRSVTTFLISLLSIGMKVMLLISVASLIGVETTSFVAVLGAAGLAVGLALQGSLANFAGGVLILLFKPFRAGDFIESQGQSGEVKAIQVFNTVLHTLDNKTVILANGALANGTIINHFAEPHRMVELKLKLENKLPFPQIKEAFMIAIDQDPLIITTETKPIFVGIEEFSDKDVTYLLRFWCKSVDYRKVLFAVNERLKATVDTFRKE